MWVDFSGPASEKLSDDIVLFGVPIPMFARHFDQKQKIARPNKRSAEID